MIAEREATSCIKRGYGKDVLRSPAGGGWTLGKYVGERKKNKEGLNICEWFKKFSSATSRLQPVGLRERSQRGQLAPPRMLSDGSKGNRFDASIAATLWWGGRRGGVAPAQR